MLCAIAYDGVQPGELAGEDRELARELFGDVDEIPASALAVLVAVCGARGGKSYILLGLRILHLALRVDLSTLAPGELGVGALMAPRLEDAEQSLRYIQGAIRTKPELQALVDGKSDLSDNITIRRGHQRVKIVCLASSSRGLGGRGKSLVGAALDEACFFRDKDYKVNDEEVYRALSPRVLPGGQVLIASTPWAEQGLVWEFYSKNFGDPHTCVVAHAPTLTLYPSERNRQSVAAEQARDPDNAEREFGAAFMGASTAAFFDPRKIDEAIDPTLTGDLEHQEGWHATVAADLAFNADHAACVATYFDELQDRITVGAILELRPTKAEPLKPSVVVGAFAAIAKARGSEELWGDEHYKESAREHLQASGVTLMPAPTGQPGKVAQYLKARALFHGGQVRIPDSPNGRRLVSQLKAVVEKPTPGGGLSITSPRKPGSGHGDIASAFVLAVWAAKSEMLTDGSIFTIGGRWSQHGDRVVDHTLNRASAPVAPATGQVPSVSDGQRLRAAMLARLNQIDD